jgi:hypothetical protein
MCTRVQQRASLQVAVVAGLLAAAGTVHAGGPAMPILIRHAVFARASLKPELRAPKPLSLALPDDIVRETRVSAHAQLLPNQIEVEPDENGIFFGPQFFDPTRAARLRGMVTSMPERAKKILTAPVGPWAMSAQSIGNSWSAGPALYARF